MRVHDVNDREPLFIIRRVILLAHGKRWHEHVNIRGERIGLPTDGPLERAAWMKERIARPKEVLPDCYCGLPLVQSCPTRTRA